jgi:hypothetical protein
MFYDANIVNAKVSWRQAYWCVCERENNFRLIRSTRLFMCESKLINLKLLKFEYSEAWRIGEHIQHRT